jgi:hypothetical protein
MMAGTAKVVNMFPVRNISAYMPANCSKALTGVRKCLREQGLPSPFHHQVPTVFAGACHIYRKKRCPSAHNRVALPLAGNNYERYKQVIGAGLYIVTLNFNPNEIEHDKK